MYSKNTRESTVKRVVNSIYQKADLLSWYISIYIAKMVTIFIMFKRLYLSLFHSLSSYTKCKAYYFNLQTSSTATGYLIPGNLMNFTNLDFLECH
jgi:hypothetical protein